MKIEIKNYIYIIFGTLLVSLGVVLFFLSNDITTGGSPGFALLVHHIFDYSIGSIIIAFNIPLLIVGIRYLGKTFAIRTIVTIFLMSTFVDLLIKVLHVKSITDDIFLASIFGGIFVGIGVGFILRGNSSAGGSTIIAKIVCANSEFKPGQVILALDLLIILTSIYVFNDVEKSLWSIVSIYATSKVVDTMLSGSPTKKVVHLVSKKSEELAQIIIKDLGDNGTIVKGRGLHVDEEKTMIFIVVELRKLRLLRELVQANDSEAFMVVMDASELLGRGN